MVEDGKTGMLVEYGQPEQLADRIEFLIDHPEAISRMSRAALNRFDELFTAERYFERLVRIFHSLSQDMTR
jgi:glycosyltransferase involved in cell wall biosynthesis